MNSFSMCRRLWFGLVLVLQTVSIALADDYDVLRANLIAHKRPTTFLSDTTVTNLLGSMNQSPSSTEPYLWSTAQFNGNPLNLSGNNTAITTTYNNLLGMTWAYVNPARPAYYHNASLLASIKIGLAWMHDNYYGSAVLQPSENGASQSITYGMFLPEILSTICSVLYDDPQTEITKSELLLYMDAVQLLVVPVYSGRLSCVGVNLLERADSAMLLATIAKTHVSNPTADPLMTECKSKINSTFTKTTGSSSGWHADGSYLFHTSSAYNSGYGRSLLTSVIAQMSSLHQTPWQISSLRTKVYEYFYSAQEPIIHDGVIWNMMLGRWTTAVSSGDKADSTIRDCLNLSKFGELCGDATDPARLKSIAKYHMKIHEAGNLKNVSVPYSTDVYNNPAILPRGSLAGHYSFADMDRVVHARPGYAFGLSMYSSRAANYETNGDENLRGWHTGDGQTVILNADKTQYAYAEEYMCTVDPYRLPGVTTATTRPRSNGSYSETKSPNNWVGGVTHGLHGATGMQFSSPYLSNSVSTLVAKKSWFMFDKEIVCLGTGITSTDTNLIETTVENRRLTATGNNAFTVNGLAQPTALTWNVTLPGVSWAHLAGNVTGLDLAGNTTSSDIGYYFPQPATLKAVREARTGKWSNVRTNGNSTTTYTNNFLRFGFEHGTTVTNSTYQYVLLPGLTATQTGEYAAAPKTFVLRNDSNVQAVRQDELGIVALNSWNDGTQTVGPVTVDKKCSVMMQTSGGFVDVSVNDPTQSNTGFITVQLATRGTLVNKDPQITVVQTTPVTILQVNVNGGDGKSFHARFNAPSGAKSPATVNLSNLVQIYNGSARSVTATTIPAGLTVDLTYNDATSPPTAVGSYLVTGTINDPDYEGSSSGTLEIVAATGSTTLARTSGPASSNYGDALEFRAEVVPNPGDESIITFKVNGVSIGTAETTSGVATLSTSSLSYSGGAFLPVTADFGGNGNILASTGTLEGGQQINRKPLTLIGATAQSKLFDGNTIATISPGTLAGIVNGDVVSATNGFFTQSAVGTGIPVIVSLSGASSGNYVLSQPGLTANILSKATWTNPDGGLWGSSVNWLSSCVGSGSAITADFSPLDPTADITVSLDSPRSINSLVFGDSVITAGSESTWTLANNGNPANTLALAGTTPTVTVNALGAGKILNISARITGMDGLTKSGVGTLGISGVNTYAGPTTLKGGSVLAIDGIGLPSGSYLSFNGGVFESSGIFTRGLAANGSNKVGWVGSASGGLGGGFAAKGSPLTVNLGGSSATVNWSSAGGANLSGTLHFGSPNADQKVLFQNPINLNNSTRTINVAAGTGSDAAEISGTISYPAAVGINKTGNGGLILSASNTYQGSTMISAGKLQIGNGGITGSLHSTSSINNSGTLAFDRSDAISQGTHFGLITGSGSLIKSGLGRLTLTGVNAYTGATNINTGTLALAVTGSINASSSINIGAGSTWDVSAIAAYNLSGGTILNATGTEGSAAVIKGGTTVNLGTQPVTLTFNPVNFSGDTTHPALMISTGTLSLTNNSFTIHNDSGTALGAGTYRLIQQVTGSVAGSVDSSTLTVSGAGLAARTTATLSISAGGLDLLVADIPKTITTTAVTRTVGSSPSTYGDSLTFRAVVSPDPGDGATVTFKINGMTAGWGATTSGAADFIPNTLPYSGGSAYAIDAEFAGNVIHEASSGSLSGGQRVNRKTLTLTGAAAQDKIHDGTTNAVIAGGYLSGLLEGDEINVSSGTFAQSAIGTGIPVSAILSGITAGNYILADPGLTAEIVDPSFAIWTNPAGGLWDINSNWLSNHLGTGSGIIADFSRLNPTADLTVRLDTPRTIGSLIFGDTNMITPAGWTIANNSNPANILTLAGTIPTITVHPLGAGKSATIGAVVAGSSGLRKAGAGKLTLTGSNNYTGPTALNGGTLQATHATGLPGASYLSFNGGVLETSGTFSRSLGTSGGTVGWIGQNSGGLGGGFAAKGGTLTLRFGNSTSPISFAAAGGANLSGVLQFGSTTADSKVILQNGVSLNGSERTINVTAGSGNADSTSAEISGTIDGANSSGRLIKTGDGSLILSGINTWQSTTKLRDGVVEVAGSNSLGVGGQIVFEGGTLRFTSGSATWDPSSRITAGTSTGPISIHTGGQNITFATALTATQSGGLTKMGTGTLNLNGANTYTGLTQVNTGTVALGASGSISTNVSIAAGAKLNTTAKSSYTLPAILAFDIDSAGSSGQIDATGRTLVISSAAVTFNIVGTLGAPVYVLATYGARTGTTFTSVTPPSGYTLDYDYNNGTQIALVETSGFTTLTTDHSMNHENFGLTSDPDCDGICNLLEYVLNSNPESADPSALPSLAMTATDFEFTYSRSDASLADTIQTFEYGSTLDAWTPIPIPTGPGTSSSGVATIFVTDGGSTDSIRIRIPKSAASGGLLWGRLKVTRP